MYKATDYKQQYIGDNKAEMMIIDKIAFIYINNGKILSTRSRGKDKYYIPGGKREPGESDLETLMREIEEELSVLIVPSTVKYIGTYQAQAHGHAEGVMVKMTCYSADYTGELRANSEIEEIVWLASKDTDKISPVDQLIFADLKRKEILS